MKVKKVLTILMVFLLLTFVGGELIHAETLAVERESEVEVGYYGMVSSAHPLSTEAGLKMLQNGGNAVDAAVAVGFSLGVVEPFASGIGGEGVMLVYLAEEDEVIAIDYKGTAPAEVPLPEDYDRERYGATAPVIPGTPAGLAHALEKYGTMELAEVMQPAIEYARGGYEVYQFLFDTIGTSYDEMNDAAYEIFMPEDSPPFPGELFVQEDLANTLELIAEEGIDEFYEGEIANKISEYMAENGGYITEEDLADYTPIEKEPVTGNYRGHEIYSSPPPVSGAILVNMLNILEGYNLEKYREYPLRYTHLLAETFKLSHADYSDYIIDPDFGNPPIEDITSEEYAFQRRHMITNEAIDGREGGLGLESSDIISSELSFKDEIEMDLAFDPKGSTSHFVVADREGNMVSATNTLSHYMGSQTVIPDTGILMNNTLGLFRDDPDDVGRIEPGKRTRSMLVPTLITKDNEPFMAVGSPGGTRIISTTAQTIVNVIDHDMNIQEAIDQKRLACFISWIHVEDYPEELVSELEGLGYDVRNRDYLDDYFGGVHAILFEDPVMFGGADPRRNGKAVGY